MRRALLLALVALGVAAPSAVAAPATVAGNDQLQFVPANVAVEPGESVTWTFNGTEQAHNVAGNGSEPADAAWAGFTFPPKIAAPPVSYTFTTPGVYQFICTVHSDMTGSVVVGEGAVPLGSNPPPSQQPFGNDATAPVTIEKVSLDKAKPRLSSVSARRASGAGAVRVRFRVNEQSEVQVRLKRGGRTIKTATARGTGTRSVTVRGARAGRYRVEVRATDIAGNRSSLKRTSITVR